MKEDDLEMDSELTEDILTNIFERLEGSDLKSCRAVCQSWESLTTPLFGEKTCVIFDGKMSPGKILLSVIPFLSKSTEKSKDLINYLDQSETKFSLWKAMRLRAVTTAQVSHLLQNSSLGSAQAFRLTQALQTVTKLDLIRCRIDVLPFMEFLTYFTNLEIYADDHSIYYAPTFFTAICQSMSQLEASMTEKYSQVTYPFKTLALRQRDVDPNSRILLKMLTLTCSRLETFGLELQSDKSFLSFTRRAEFCSRLGLFLLRHVDTLKKLSLQWYNHEYDLYFEDCVSILLILSIDLNNLRIEELELGFQWVFLSNPHVQDILIPFVSSLKCLKKFTFSKVIIHGANTLDCLKRMIPEGTDVKCEIGALICDGPVVDMPQVVQNIREQKAALESDFLIRNLVSLLLTFDTATVATLESMLPFKEGLSYENMYEFSVSCRSFEETYGRLGFVFSNYNMALVVKAFPNLTELRLFDGPPFEYDSSVTTSSQYNQMSMASIGNFEMQVIISHLINLKKLKFRAKMFLLSDSGITGLSWGACEKMSAQTRYKITMAMASTQDYIGVRISELKCLEELTLQGLSPNVTNITACLAFDECEKLKELNLYGRQLFTRSGKDHLRGLAKQKGFKFDTNV